MVGIVTYLPPKQFTVNISFNLTINILINKQYYR